MVHRIFSVTVDSIIERIIYLTGFHLFLILFLFSYYQTIFTQLGRPPSNVNNYYLILIIDYIQFYVSREVRHELEMSENDIESRQIIERYVRHQQLPINTRAFDGCKMFIWSGIIILFICSYSILSQMCMHQTRSMSSLFYLWLLHTVSTSGLLI